MELDFSPGALINAGGALLFLLAGIAILAVARRTRLGLRLGAFAATFGLAYVVENLVDYDVDPVSAAILLVPALAAAVCLGFLIVELVRDVARPAQKKVAFLATAIGLSMAVAAVVLFAREVENPGLVTKIGTNSVGAIPLTWLVQPFLLVLLAAAAQAPTGESSLRRYKGRMLLALAAGLFAVNIDMVSAASSSPDQSWKGPLIDSAGLLLGVLVAFTGWLVLHGRPPGAETFARRSLWAIVLVGLAGCLQQAFASETSSIGPFGIIRSVGAVLLVLAVVKYDVLGVKLPRIAVNRGVAAAGALAVLFIVAQVAQNFFSAEYGLLMGGILAGTFVFAASPIQRAIERSGESRPTNAPNGGSRGKEEAYRSALRFALRDRALSAKERVELAHLADELGIAAGRAAELEEDVASASDRSAARS